MIHYKFSPQIWESCQYQLRAVATGQDVFKKQGWHKHWHSCWVVDVGGGPQGWCRVRGKTFKRSRSSVAVYAPRVMYEENFELGKLQSWAWMLLEETNGSHSPLRQLTDPSGFTVLEDAFERIRSDIESIAQIAATATEATPFLLASHMNHAIGVLLEIGNSKSNSSKRPKKEIQSQWVHPWKRIAIEELEDAFPNPLSIKQLADKLKVAPSTLTHKYGTLCGESFSKTVARWRLQKAQILLLKENISIKEIAQQLGIAQPSYLTAFIKKETGHTPSELRRIAQNKTL